MAGKRKRRLGELLIRGGVIDESQLRAALGEQKQWGRPLGMTLVQMGFLDEESLIRTLARQLKLPMAWLNGKRVKPEVLELVPSELAAKYRCLPLLVTGEGDSKTLMLAMQDPADFDALDEVAFRVGYEIKPVLVAPGELDEALNRHYLAESPGEADSIGEFATGDENEPEDEPDLLVLENVLKDAELPALKEGGKPSDPLADAPSSDILRALTELLLAKGLITREELDDRLGQVGARGSDLH